MFRVITDLLRRYRVGYPALESELDVPPERARLDPEEEARRQRRRLAQEAYIRVLEAEAGLLARQDAANRDKYAKGEER